MLVALCGLLAGAQSCGYRFANSAGRLPEGIRSLGIPTFKNTTQQYRVEQQLSGAVLKEFSARTVIPVNSSSSGVDAVLEGVIQGVSSSAIAFDTNTTFGSTFLITVQISAKLVRQQDKKVLWEDPGFIFRERYVINSKVSDFFSEENPALEHLAQQFAASLASTILSH